MICLRLKFWVLLLGLGGLFAPMARASAEGGEGPRILADSSWAARRRAAAEQDDLLAELISRHMRDAVAALDESSVRFVNVDRPNLMREARSMQRRLLDWGIAWRLTSERRFLEAAERELLAAAALPNWGSAAVADGALRSTHALTIAEMMVGAAIGLDWFGDALAPETRAQARRALRSKGLDYFLPLMRDENPAWFFTTAKASNWSAVALNALTQSAFLLEQDDPVNSARVLGFVKRTLPVYLALYAPAGAYAEGPTYWNYGTMHLAMLSDAWARNRSDDLGVVSSPGLRESVDYRLHLEGPTGRVFNYADTAETDFDPPSLFFWFARVYQRDDLAAHFRQRLGEELAGRGPKFVPGESWAGNERRRYRAFELLWYPEGGERPSGPRSLPTAVHFPGGADVFVARTAWSGARSAWVGFKAGDNRASHGHLDLGSFVYEADGVRWAVDLGPESYNLVDRIGWDRRYDLFRISTRSHNTLVFGDANQRPDAVAGITAWTEDKFGARAIADLSSAYSGAAKTVRRGVRLAPDGALVVQDEVVGAAAGALRWAMATRAEIMLAGPEAILVSGERKLRARVIEPKGAVWEQQVAKPPTEEERPTQGVTLLVLRLPVGPAPLRIVTALAPEGAALPEAPLPSLDAWILAKHADASAAP